MMSPVETKSSGVARFDLGLPVGVALGEVERRLEIKAVRAIVKAVVGGLVGREGAVHGIALDRSIGEPQGEGGVGVS